MLDILTKEEIKAIGDDAKSSIEFIMLSHEALRDLIREVLIDIDSGNNDPTKAGEIMKKLREAIK